VKDLLGMCYVYLCTMQNDENAKFCADARLTTYRLESPSSGFEIVAYATLYSELSDRSRDLIKDERQRGREGMSDRYSMPDSCLRIRIQNVNDPSSRNTR
jgi:hypothetical protein